MNVHTPLYNTNLNKHTSDPNAPSSWSTVPVEQQQYGMLKQFEAAFFKKYSVNFVFAGHVHTYERFQAMYNGTAADATGTVFMSVGTGGSVGDFGGYPPYTDAKGVRWTQNGKVWIASNCLLTKTLTLTLTQPNPALILTQTLPIPHPNPNPTPTLTLTQPQPNPNGKVDCVNRLVDGVPNTAAQGVDTDCCSNGASSAKVRASPSRPLYSHLSSPISSSLSFLTGASNAKERRALPRPCVALITPYLSPV